MDALFAAAADGAPEAELARLAVPDAYRAVVVRQPDPDRPGRALRVEEVPVPPVGAGEVLVAVMASALNYTTVWAALGHPVPTSRFLARLGPPHDAPFHAVGSDAAGVVVRAGPGVGRWRPGDRVVVAASWVDGDDPAAHDDALLAPGQRVWGYETNFGGLGELALVRASQLLPKPAHLSWEEAASLTLCSSTAYRMVVSPHGAAMRQGDVVLVWGATGGVGSYAVQYVRNGGGIPVGVVSSPQRAELARRLGCAAVIDRTAENYRFWSDPHTQDEAEWRRFGSHIRALVSADPDIVVEHPGRETMGASVFVARRGGTVVTCAATSGYRVEFDNRHLWMKLKRVVGTQLANLSEAAAANRLACAGAIQPTLSAVHPLEATGEAAESMFANRHTGKLGVLCLAPDEGLGVDDAELRRRVGPERIAMFRS